MQATIDEEGRPLAFYDAAIHGDSVPEGAIEISVDQWRECLENPGTRRFEDGEIVECELPPMPQLVGMPDGITDPMSAEYVVYQIDKNPLVSALSDLVCESAGISKEQLAARVLTKMGDE